MTREEKCLIAIEKGYIYNQETGIVTGPSGKDITRKHKEGYIHFSVRYDKKYFNLRCHQFGWFWVNKECTECLDHINQIKNDNRISNLRKVTKQENNFNVKSVKGYCWDKARNKWAASIALNEKQIFLGRFDNEEDARAAYLAAKEKYHIFS